MSSPITQAFEKLISEIYWIEELDEAEQYLAKHIENMDEDLREVLLTMRKKICDDPEVVLQIIRLEALADSTKNDTLRDVLLLRGLLDMLFLVQCSPKWSKMSPKEKAKVLTPLYKASYGLQLAMKNFPDMIDKIHLSIAYTMAEEAYERADRMSLTSDVYKLLHKLSEKVLQEYDETGGGDDRRA